MELFTADDRFLHSVVITGGYVLVAVPLQLAAALAAALLLVRDRRGKSVYRSLFYLPSLLAASVAVSITWRAMFDYGGAVNGVLGWFGVSERSWINDPATVIWTIVALEVWRFGAPMVIFLAGLKQIPGELYEAAALDAPPAELDDMYLASNAKRHLVYDYTDDDSCGYSCGRNADHTIDTVALAGDGGYYGEGGIQGYTFAIENWVFDRYDAFMADLRTGNRTPAQLKADLAAWQQSMAQTMKTHYINGTTPS
ncbi:hypothetical protein GCM10010404_63070 [Nonomuraea africana]